MVNGMAKRKADAKGQRGRKTSTSLDRFWTGVRRKVELAEKEVREGKTVDGETAMNRIIASLKRSPRR
jgi:hypothetical protein